MKKITTLLLAIILMGCKSEPKDYVTLSGKITNKNSDSLVVRTLKYFKTIAVNNDGTFKDTLKVNAGIYNLFDGKEATSIFLKNGFDLNIAIDTKAFDETVTFSGNGAEHSNFLAEHNLLLEELLNMDTLNSLNMEALNNTLGDVNTKLSEFYDSHKEVDSSIVNNLKKDLDPMLKFYKNYIGKSIALKTELPEGSPSPIFKDYENAKGGTTSLADLKGKYVYIDVWATWCGPCKAEIPSLKKLEKAYHDKNIQFVSLSVDDGRGYRAETKEASFGLAKNGWKKMITDKELGGIQLLAPNGWQSQFIQDYKINGIPRFLLIDPEGNIVTPDAPRPSSTKITELFEALNI